MAQTDSTTHYTFKVIAEKAGNEFYNLVFEVTTTGEINEFVILKYQPNISWLEDTATPFNGLVSIENDMFSPEDIDINALRPITNCATGASTSWLCSNNNPHGPSVGPPACYASSFSFVITIEWGACGTGTGNGSPIPVPQYTPNDNTYTGNGGTTGGFNSNSPVNTRPLSSPQEDIILCLSIDDLTGNSLLSQSTKDCLLTSAIPRAKINTLNNYLSDNACSTEAQSFGNLAAQAICDGGEVDYPDTIVLEPAFLANQKAKCVYNKIKDVSNTLFNDILTNQFASSRTAHLKLNVTTPPNGEDAFTKGIAGGGTGIFEIQLDPVVVSNASTIEIALMLIHESIHAELLSRCVELGIIVTFDGVGNPVFATTPPVPLNTGEAVFAFLVDQYRNFGGANTQWNHDLFNVLSYRIIMAQNLVSIHPWLNDTENNFLTNVNGDSLNLYGDFTIEQLMSYMTWIGLEGTQEFTATIANVPLETTKKNFVETSSRTHFTHNCN